MKTPAAPRLAITLAALLAVSLAGNAALLLRASRSKAGASRSAASSSASDFPRLSTDVSASAQVAVSPELAADLSRALSGSSLTGFRDLLDAAGVDPKLRRDLLQAALSHRYQQSFRDSVFPYGELMRREWWREPVMDEYHPGGLAAKRRQEESLALGKRFNAELAELLGDDIVRLDLEDPDNGWLARRFSGLPKEKAEALLRIERDYQELEQEIHARSGDFQLPEDQEKLRLLKEEQARDTAALLTPEERTEWELRSSPTADRARQHATRYRATEEEYRRIYALQKTFDDTFDFDPFSSTGPQQEQDWKVRQEAERALEAEIRAIIGEDRHAEALRRQSSDFNLAQAAAARLGLPEDTANRIYDLREPAAEASRRIAADTTLGPDERKSALARLAADTRATLESTLGKEAAASYFERGGMSWLRALEQGTPIQFDQNRDSYSPVSTGEPDSEPLAPRIHID